MNDAYPSNRAIAKALKRILPELVRRYGRHNDCTKDQLETTCKDLKIIAAVYPYLCAACLSAVELELARRDNAGVNWAEVENRARLLVEEFNSKKIPFSDRFYESGIGMMGAPP